jgi:hypothetical protein
MKARIYTSAFGLSVTVADESRKVERDAHAVRGAARVVANKLAGVDKLHKDVTSAQRFCIEALQSLSMPYAGEDGWRLLPTKNFMNEAPNGLLPTLAQGKAQFQAALDALANQADDMLEQARKNLGALDVKLPGKQELIGSYSMRHAFEELPTGFIPGLPEATRQSLQRRADRALEACAHEAREHVLKSFVKPLEALVGAVRRIDEYEDAKGKWKEGDPKPATARFSDSLVSNVWDLYKNLDSLNVLDDPDIRQLGEMVKGLAESTPNDLRASEAIRQDAARKAQTALDHLGGWLKIPSKPVTSVAQVAKAAE